MTYPPCTAGECLASVRIPCPSCGRTTRTLEGQSWEFVPASPGWQPAWADPNPEWVESVGGARRPDAPRYPAVPTSPDKRKAGRDSKAPKGEGLTICVRLEPAAIKALEALKARGLKTTAAVNAALIATVKP